MVLSSNSSTIAVHSSNLDSSYKSRIFRGNRFLVDSRNGGWATGWEVWVWLPGTGTRLLELGTSASLFGVLRGFDGLGPGTSALSRAGDGSWSAEEQKPLFWDSSFPWLTAGWCTFLEDDEFLVTVRFSPSAVIMLPFLLTTVMRIGSYTVPPFDTENGLLTSTDSPVEMLQGFT